MSLNQQRQSSEVNHIVKTLKEIIYY